MNYIEFEWYHPGWHKVPLNEEHKTNDYDNQIREKAGNDEDKNDDYDDEYDEEDEGDNGEEWAGEGEDHARTRLRLQVYSNQNKNRCIFSQNFYDLPRKDGQNKIRWLKFHNYLEPCITDGFRIQLKIEGQDKDYHKFDKIVVKNIKFFY